MSRICALSAARIHTVLELDDEDFTYTVVPDLIFGALEIELGIVNACLPNLAPVVSKCFGPKSTFRRTMNKVWPNSWFASKDGKTDGRNGKKNKKNDCGDKNYDHLHGNAYYRPDEIGTIS